MVQAPERQETPGAQPSVAELYPEKQKTPWYKADYYVGRAVKLEEVMNFSRQTAAFLRAGVPILDSLAVVAEENASKKMTEVLGDLQLRLRSGSSFGDALAHHPKVFPGYFIAVVRAAELTGKLDDAMDQLAEYIERDVNARKELKSQLTYPIIVFFLAIAAVVIMSVFILPKFDDFYTGLDAKLPLPTRMLMNFTSFMSEWWWLIALLFVVSILVAFLVLGGNSGKPRRDALLLKLPGIGPILHLVAVERFCSVLAALVHSGVPLPDAVQVSADSTNNFVFKSKLATAREAMMRGEGLARPIQASGLFPPAARQMIRVGESTGSLDVQLDSAATFYQRELKYKLKKLTDTFEPVIILVVGGMVAFVAIAQIAAMYSVYNQVQV